MSGLSGALLLLGLAGAAVFSWWLYFRREFPVSKRGGLAALRASAALLILLLLIDPRIPVPGGQGDRGPWLLLDASASMAVRDADGEGAGGASAWDRALRLVRGGEGADGLDQRPGDEPGAVILFGVEARRVGVDSLPLESPLHVESRLAPAVRLAAELGAPGIRVVTDGRISDRDRVAEALAGSGLPSSWEDVGAEVRHAGILTAVAPGRLVAGDTAEVGVTLFGEGLDSVAVVAVLEGGDSTRAVAAVPSVGRAAIARLFLPLPADSGRAIVKLRLETSDPFPADDTLTLELAVGRPRGGVVLVTTRPGWESRSLLPVVSRSAGLVGRGFLQLSDGRFLTLETDGAAPGVVSGESVAAAMDAAELLILEGLDSRAPEWLVEAANRGVPSIHLAGDRAEAELAGVSVGEPLSGEWYPREDTPASPLLSSLSGADWTGIPPLEGPLPLTAPSPDALGPSGDPPIPVLHAARARGGAPVPVVVLTGAGESRGAVALASGFWRWDAREGIARANYARLWSAVAGWILAGESASMAGVADAGDPVEGVDDLVPPPDPRAEMSYPRIDPAGLVVSGDEGAGPSGPGRPLRQFPLPYLLVIALLCVEWIVRRREGLR